jgi:hypothetical protein
MNNVEKRLKKPNGDPNFNIYFYALNTDGEHASMAMYHKDEDEKGYAGQTNSQFCTYSFCDENGPRTEKVDGLLPGTPQH